MKKVDYEKPLAELYNVQLDGALLTNSAEKMRTVTGYWDEEED